MSTDVSLPVPSIQQFDFSLNLLKSLLWEYNKAENLQTILEEKQEWYDANQQQFWENWITDVFTLATANEFGLFVWSIILDFPLTVVNPPSPLTQPTFGFNASFFTNFNRGNFGTRTGSDAGLSPAMQRLALQFRYFQLCSSGTVPEVNRFLNYLFSESGPAFLVDNHDMTQNYIFMFALTAEFLYLINNYDILPRPAGVENFYRDGTKQYFGFGASRLNFNRGNFLH